MAYILLFFAIATEVAGSLLLRLSHGFEKIGIGLLAVALFIVSLALLSSAMKSIPISVSYPLWAGLGIVGALIGGRLLFAEHISLMQIAGVVLVLVGIITIRVSQGGNS
jgi:multidrug transporter EmrE-like cation transporter